MFWMTAFLDLPADTYDDTVAFWRAVTGYDLSPARGEHSEFASLVPPSGDEHLRVQRLGPDHQGGPRIHLDLHVADPRAAADRARALGATEIRDRGYVVMTSPGGFTFCFVPHPGSEAPDPADWGDGLTSIVDQVCLDIPGSLYRSEVEFWTAVTGREHRVSPTWPIFERLVRPPGEPVQLLLQELDDRTGTVRAHLDLATTDRARETGRHLDLGATLVRVFSDWTVLADPSGAAYCVTDRLPGARILDAAPAEESDRPSATTTIRFRA